MQGGAKVSCPLPIGSDAAVADDAESFLARWSRRKQAMRGGRAAEPSAGPAEDKSADHRPPPPAPPDAEAPPDLPAVDTLTKDSDYTGFLRAGVPEALRRSALRKLWTSDPVLANLDGLVEYGEDFGATFRAPGIVETVYRIGEGMPEPEREREHEKPSADAPPLPESGKPASAGEADTAAAEPPSDAPGATRDS